MSTPPTVLIIGCGIAGPVLGNFYKRKGYHPIVFDKVPQLGDAGASLMLMSNGLKVLDLVGLAGGVKSESTPIEAFHDETSDGLLLGHSDVPKSFAEKYRQPCVGIKRTSINLALKKMLIDLEVDLREGWELLDIQENEDSVTAFFDGGRQVTGSFLVGCDGIKSATRAALQRNKRKTEGLPSYTGLTQTAGISATPARFLSQPTMRNWYGDGVHAISYPISPDQTSWAITQRETQETEETWRPYSSDELPEQKKHLGHLVSGWHADVLSLVKNSERIIKFGLFDRKELQANEWYSKRCVLVGDAAHPTSPHLGQGANQALEDCFNLSHAMPFLDSQAQGYQESLSVLGPGLAETTFKPFAEKRQPRTSALVKAARMQGDSRVVAGVEPGKRRDEAIKAAFKDPAMLETKFSQLLVEPFQNL